MADIRASLSLEFALRADSALKTLGVVSEQLSKIEDTISKIAGNITININKTEAAVAAVGEKTQEVADATKAHAEALKAAQDAVAAFNTQVGSGVGQWGEISAAIDKIKFSNLSWQKISEEQLEQIAQIDKYFKSLTVEQKKALNLSEKTVKQLKIVSNITQELPRYQQKQVKWQELFSAALGKGTVEFANNVKYLGVKLALVGATIDALIISISDSDKLLRHFSTATYAASGNAVGLTLNVSRARLALGLSAEEAIKAGEAVYLAGVRMNDVNQQFAQATVQVAMLARAYGVSEAASAEFLAAQTMVLGDVGKAGAVIEDLAVQLSKAGLSGAEATTVFQKGAKASRELSVAFNSSKTAGADYTKTLIYLGQVAKITKTSFNALAEVLDMVTKGGPDAVMAMGAVAFSGKESSAAMAATVANFPNLEKRVAKLQPWMKQDAAMMKALTGLTLEQYNALEKQYKLEQEWLKDPAKKAEYEKSIKLSEAYDRSIKSGREALERFMNSVSALLGYAIIPLNYALGFTINLIQQSIDWLSGLGASLGMTKDNAEEAGKAIMGGATGLLLFGAASKGLKSIGLPSILSMINPMRAVRGIKSLTQSFKAMRDEGGLVKGFLTKFKESLSPAADSAKKLTDATSKMTPGSGENSKTFLQKFAAGLKSLASVKAAQLAKTLFVVIAAIAAMAIVFVGISIAIKEFGLSAKDLIIGASALLVGIGILGAAMVMLSAIGTGVTVTAPFIWMAIAVILALAVAMIGFGYAATLFADAFSTIMNAWDPGKAFPFLGWMMAAGTVMQMAGIMMLIGGPGIIFGAGALWIMSKAMGAISEVMPAFSAGMILFGTALGVMAIGMRGIAATATPFLGAMVATATAIGALAAAMFFFPHKWFRHAAETLGIWSKAVARLPERSAAKLAGLRDVLKEIRNIPRLSISDAADTTKALNMLTPSVNSFMQAMSGLSEMELISDKFTKAIDKIAEALNKFRGFDNTDLRLAVSTVQAINTVPATTVPLQPVADVTVKPASGIENDKIIRVLEEQKAILSDLRERAVERGSSLKDILNQLKDSMPDGYLGSSSLTKEASDW